MLLCVCLTAAAPPHTHPPLTQLRVLAPTVRLDAAGVVLAEVHSAAAGAPPFDLSLSGLASGAVRMRLLERHDLPPRWEVRVGPATKPRPARP